MPASLPVFRSAGAREHLKPRPDSPLLKSAKPLHPPTTNSSVTLFSLAYAAGGAGASGSRLRARNRAAQRRLGPADFELLCLIGKGAFGKVYQVRKKDSGERGKPRACLGFWRGLRGFEGVGGVWFVSSAWNTTQAGSAAVAA